MKKLIVILTLCMFTSVTVATPIAAAEVTATSKNTKTATITCNAGNINNSLNIDELLSKFKGTKCNNLKEVLAAANNAAVKSGESKLTTTKTAKSNKKTKVKKAKKAKKVTTAKKSTTTTTTKPSTTTTKPSTTTTKPSTTTTKPSTTTTTKPSTTATTKPSTTTTTKPSTTTTTNNTTSSYREFQKRVIDLVNKERAAAGLSALTENAELDKVATLKSEDMAKLGYFSHTSPTYGSPFDMLKQFGIRYTSAGENIAYGQSSPEEVMNGWMNSPGHRANILDSNYTQIGVGIAKKPNGQLVWTQTFLRP